MGVSKVVMIDNKDAVWEKLFHDNISLENVVIRDKTKYGQYVVAVMGKVRVTNFFYEKHVFARVTTDNWETYQDYSGSHLETSKDKCSDVFSFGFTHREKKVLDVEFALACRQGGKETWDNNGGQNYQFQISEKPFSR